MTLREAAVREWPLLPPDARAALRRYMLQYVIGCPAPRPAAQRWLLLSARSCCAAARCSAAQPVYVRLGAQRAKLYDGHVICMLCCCSLLGKSDSACEDAGALLIAVSARA